MQFKHPEFLFALFLLLIPIVIHFFQWRHYKTEYFTNVRLLKQVVAHSKKRSALKKWLVLLTRLLGLAALVMAFAQPFMPSEVGLHDAAETVIYVDNSYSMQQKGERGELLEQAVQELVQGVPEEKTVRFLTNDRTFPSGRMGDLKNELLKIQYSSAPDAFHTVALRAQNAFSGALDDGKHFIAISDFQKKNFEDPITLDSTIVLSYVQLKGKGAPNFSIDSIALEDRDSEYRELIAYLSSSEKGDYHLAVDLWDGETIFAKNNAHFADEKRTAVAFPIPKRQEIQEGKLVIEDHQLRFDNTFFFSLQDTQKIQVVTVSEKPEDQLFLKKLFKSEEFNLDQELANEIDYQQFGQAHLIILNGLSIFPPGLEAMLKEHFKKGGYLTLIPPRDSRMEGYNTLLQNLGMQGYTGQVEEDLKLTTIHFSHPLYAGVFDGEIDNFQYPTIHAHYGYKGGAPILEYNNQEAFLAKNGRVYIFTASFSPHVNNFVQSPLIVPTFYNMALQSFQPPKPAYVIGEQNKVEIALPMTETGVVHLTRKGVEGDLIPPQRRFDSKIELDLSAYPTDQGIYRLSIGERNLGTLAFNHAREEHEMNFMNFQSERAVSDGLKQFLRMEDYENTADTFWKWFVTFALMALIAEFLILKYLK